jgi:uncharacterized protein YeaO (DUF488 family)
MEKSHPMTHVSIKRAYDDPEPGDGFRVLVDRVWPRGRTRESLKLDHQAPELAPSVALRKWFAHDPKHWTEFHERYEQELRIEATQARIKELLAAAHGRHITLVYGAKDTVHNHAVILRDAIQRLAGTDSGS